MRHVLHQQNKQASASAPTSIQNLINYLDRWGVRHLDDLFAVREITGRCCRNVPRSRRGLNISIYRLAYTQQQQYTKLPTLRTAVTGQRGVRGQAGSGHITIVGLVTPLRRSGFTEGFQAILEHEGVGVFTSWLLVIWRHPYWDTISPCRYWRPPCWWWHRPLPVPSCSSTYWRQRGWKPLELCPRLWRGCCRQMGTETGTLKRK